MYAFHVQVLVIGYIIIATRP